MASPCKRQQCTIERRGFRQELDSWRHKLIHCVGFESILEGLFDPGLVEDLKLFKGCEPEAVSDWSFDENCLFCCLRRDKVKEHLVSLSNQGLEDTPKPLLVKDQTKISRLEKQAEEFLNAVLYRKDVPSFSDPHIPIVAREIMQRMIRQFAAEYTSKTSSTQDSLSDPQPSTDQSLARPPSFSGAPPSTSPSATLATSAAHNQNPVLSKLLMADQDSPLDLTVKKPPAEPSEQDGVLDLSLKTNRHSSRLSVHTPPYQSAPASTIKGEPPEVHGAKATELQSTSTLEQFMAKLCPHHQRQIVDALGFLQTEAKASGCSSASQASNPTSGSQGAMCSTALPNLETPEKPCSQSRLPITSTPKGMLDVRETSHITSGSATVKSVIDTAISLKTSIIAGPALDLRTPGSGSTTGLSIPSLNAVDAESSRHGDHAPSLKVIIKSDGKADGKKLCVLPSSLYTHSGTLEEKQGNSDLSNRAEAHSARLSSAVKRHSQSGQLQQARQRGSIGPTKDSQGKVSVHKAFSTIPLNSPRTARKSMRSSTDHRPRESVRKVITDPDLGHYDIVYIDKPITECLREQRRPFTPRRNARKSTRGPMYVEEMWELKTVRTLANRNNRSNCPNPMPEPIASVTPKQVLAKPDGVPPVDMPFAGGCGETVSQQMPSEQPEERETPGMGDVVEAADSELDVLVETSQTDQSQVVKEPSTPPSPLSSPTENSETHVDADVNKMQEAGSDSEQVRESGLSEESSASETAAMAPLEADKSNEPDNEMTEEVAKEITTDQLENEQVNEAGPLLVSDEVPSSESAEQQECETLAPAEGDTVVEEEANKNEDGKEIGKDEEQPLEPQPEVQKVSDNLDGEQNHSPTAPAEEAAVEVQENDTVQPQENDTVQPQENDTVQPQENDPVQPQDNDTVKQVKIEVVPETEENDDDDYDVSSKTLDALLKELPPWRRKRGMVISLPKRLRETKHEIVGYVNGRPISASDRSLRRRSVNSAPSPRKTRVKSQVPKNTPVDDPVQNSPMPKDLPERDVTVKSENIPVVLQVEEPSPETTHSPTRASGSLIKLRRIEPRAKQIPKHTAQSTHDTDSLPDLPIDSPQTPESRRPLRSARLKQAETAESPQSVNTSSVFAKPTGPHSLPSGEDVPSVPVSSSPLPVSSAPPIPPSSAVSESSNGSAVPENTVEPSVVKPKSPETDLSDERKSMVDRSLPTKQKLISSKAEKVSEDENPQVSSQVSSPMKSQSSEENETPEPSTPLRSKRLLRKEMEGSEGVQRKAAPSSLDEKTVGGDSTNSSALDKLVKMPLRSESSKAGVSSQPLPQSTPVENRKLALRSQRLATPSTSDPRIAEKLRDIASPIRIKPEKITKMAARSSPFCETSVLSPSTVTSVIMPRNETLKQTTAQKFLGALNGEENQHLLTNLNMKFDKMQKGWLQMDKEGQTVKKHRNMSDRQAAIWKSKRRTRKPKSQDHQKHSPVQMLFMKNFSFTSICRWFLESTETKSLVIVKKVNTRLPSETQLCFHSSSGMSGTSQGVYPSLQAERLKKHLKKFAIASPVKSNPKSQKLIAKALEQEANVVGERREVFTGTRDGVTKPFYSSVEAQKQSEAQKTSGKSKNPASARILRKYSNIRLQVQQTSVRLKRAPTKRATSMKASKSGSKTNLKSTVKGQKSRLPVNKQMKESKIRKGKISSGRKATAKSPIQERMVRSPGSNRASRDLTRKDTDLPLRTSPRPGTPKRLKNKLESSKKQLEAEKTGVEKSTPTKASGTRTQIKESLQSPITESRVSENKGAEITVETSQQNTDVKPPISPDQVLTRSQRKMEATVPLTESPSSASKKVSTVAIMQGGSPRSAAKKVQEPTPTGSGTPKSVTRKGQASTPPRSGTPKSSTKRAQEPLQSPAKRTRMSHSK